MAAVVASMSQWEEAPLVSPPLQHFATAADRSLFDQARLKR